MPARSTAWESVRALSISRTKSAWTPPPKSGVGGTAGMAHHADDLAYLQDLQGAVVFRQDKGQVLASCTGRSSRTRGPCVGRRDVCRARRKGRGRAKERAVEPGGRGMDKSGSTGGSFLSVGRRLVAIHLFVPCCIPILRVSVTASVADTSSIGYWGRRNHYEGSEFEVRKCARTGTGGVTRGSLPRGGRKAGIRLPARSARRGWRTWSTPAGCIH